MRLFLRGDSGSSSVEAVLWLPIFLWVIGASIELTLVMKAQTDLWSVASNASRMVALNKMSPFEARTYALNQATGGAVYDVQVTSDGQFVETHISRSADNISGFGLIPSELRSVYAMAAYRVEPEI